MTDGTYWDDNGTWFDRGTVRVYVDGIEMKDNSKLFTAVYEPQAIKFLCDRCQRLVSEVLVIDGKTICFECFVRRRE